MTETLIVKPSGDNLSDNPVIREAKKRFNYCSDVYSYARKMWLDDYRFAEADSDNGYQWPNRLYTERGRDERPCLTINQVRQHNLQIINDSKKNTPGIKYRATGGGASYESANALTALARHVEYISNAKQAYDTATEFQVKCGVGYIRVATGYADTESFDQEIFIRRVKDPLTVFIDPDAKEADKSDATYAIIFEQIQRDQFAQMYPKYKDLAPQSALGMTDGWVTKDHITIAEYFRKVEREKKLFAVDTPGGQKFLKEDELTDDMLKIIVEDPDTAWRTVVETEIEYYVIIGDKLEGKKKIWPGKYIPIVPVIGEETMIDGRLDLKGHTRAMKDPQRMYNYWSSAATEYGALQTKTPWVAAAEAIEGFEPQWNQANRQNASVLVYNAMDDAGAPLPPPQRIPAPMSAPAAIAGMQQAALEIMNVSGQYQAQMGEQGNERTGKAIEERQRQGDNATYHYIDNQAIAIRQVGRILLDLFPHVYDTKRVLMVMAEDASEYELMIDPEMKPAYFARMATDGKVAAQALNPSVGKYEVEADVGPAYATRREEAWNALTLILTQAPQLTALIGDLMLKAGDFPMADEAAERLKRMVPPHALGQGPSLMEQALQQQLQKLQGLYNGALQELATAQLKLTGKDQLRDIDSYKAITDRVKVLGEQAMDKSELRALVMDTVREALGIDLTPVVAASEPGLMAAAGLDGQQPNGQMDLFKAPLPGAKIAPNGQWYQRNPQGSNAYSPLV